LASPSRWSKTAEERTTAILQVVAERCDEGDRDRPPMTDMDITNHLDRTAKALNCVLTKPRAGGRLG
jgi:hypothetical protein